MNVLLEKPKFHFKDDTTTILPTQSSATAARDEAMRMLNHAPFQWKRQRVSIQHKHHPKQSYPTNSFGVPLPSGRKNDLFHPLKSSSVYGTSALRTEADRILNSIEFPSIEWVFDDDDDDDNNNYDVKENNHKDEMKNKCLHNLSSSLLSSWNDNTDEHTLIVDDNEVLNSGGFSLGTHVMRQPSYSSRKGLRRSPSFASMRSLQRRYTTNKNNNNGSRHREQYFS
jgi:hypothetical protein